MAIAWEHLSTLGQAQLLHLRPDLAFERDLAVGNPPMCSRPHCGGRWFRNDDNEWECYLCNRTFDKHGNEIKPRTEKLTHAGQAFHRI